VQVEQELAKLYASQIVSNEVQVTVLSSAYSVFVNGAVLRPGKITTDRPLSALEAVMEAGGFNAARANMKAVVIIRQVGGQTRNYTIDLQSVLSGRASDPFMLEPSDIVFVPERFSWF
jgi:polysaccharide export outer membrane protein